MSGRFSAGLLGAIAAMSWLGPMPVPPSVLAELADRDAKCPRAKPQPRAVPLVVAAACST